VQVALDYSELSQRELACKLSDERGVFISESSVYRILKSRGLISSSYNSSHSNKKPQRINKSG